MAVRCISIFSLKRFNFIYIFNLSINLSQDAASCRGMSALYIFSNPSMQTGHECFLTIGMVNSCYGPYSILLIFG